MKITQLTVGELSTNCYVLASEENNAIIIDAGANSDRIADYIRQKNLNVKALVFTHGHFDHIAAAEDLKRLTGAVTYIHEEDEELFKSPDKTMSHFFTSFGDYKGEDIDVKLHDGDVITVDEIELRVMHTPGHSKGSCVFLADDDGVMFSGDTLFYCSCGRTDLYGGSQPKLMESLARLRELAGEYTVLTGHGQQTKLSFERYANPYMGTDYDDIF